MMLDSPWGSQTLLAFCHCEVSPLKPLLALRPAGHSDRAWPQTSISWFLCHRPQVNQNQLTVCGPVSLPLGRPRAAGPQTYPPSNLKCSLSLSFLSLFLSFSGGHSGVWLPGPARRWADDQRGWDHHQHQEGGWRLVGGTDQRQERFVPWQLCKSEYKMKHFSCLLCGLYWPKLWGELGEELGRLRMFFFQTVYHLEKYKAY